MDAPEAEPHRSLPPEQRSAVVGGALVLLVFSLYWSTLCPTVFWYDSAEYTAAAHVLGVPHPPGYPLYTLIAHPFSYVPGDPARAINLVSAVFGAAAVGGAYAVARELDARPTAAALGALLLATGPVFWMNSVVAEVYTPALAMLMLVLWLLIRGQASARAAPLIGAAFLAGLGLGLHLFIATCGLGFITLVLASGEEGWGRRLAVAAGCAGAALLGACIFLYIPLRWSMEPELMFVDPVTWEQHPGWWPRLQWMLRGGVYRHWFDDRVAAGELARRLLAIVHAQLTAPGLLLAIAGLVQLGRTAPSRGVALGLCAVGNAWFFFRYQVHDVAVFFLPAVAMLALLAAVGVEALARRIETLERPALTRTALGLAMLLPAFALLRSFPKADHADQTQAADWLAEVNTTLPADAVLLNYTTPIEWQRDAVFSAYGQIVLRERRDVTVVLGPLPEEVAAHLASGRPVYAYAPVPPLTRFFETSPDGPVFRVGAPRPPPEIP